MEEIDGVTDSHSSRDTADSLTKAMILHPIACAFSFFAFILALCAGFIGSTFADFVASIAWIITLIAMGIDFALFAIVKST